MVLADYSPLVSKPTQQMFSLYTPAQLWSILTDYILNSTDQRLTLTKHERSQGKLTFEWHKQFAAKIRLEHCSRQKTCIDFTYASGDYLSFVQGVRVILEDLQHIDNC